MEEVERGLVEVPEDCEVPDAITLERRSVGAARPDSEAGEVDYAPPL
jgi:hypothetical protein